jgi:sulfatase maturation enzyme AslB (radical SAM superfamily)
MTWGTLRAALDLLLGSQQRQVELEFYGGEPLLAFPLLRRGIAYAKARCPPRLHLGFGVTTNGLLLDERRAAFLARHRVRTSLSFDGLPAAQDQRAPGTFTRLDRTLDRLRQRHPGFFGEHLEVGLTLTAANLTTLADSVEYFFAKGLRTIHLNPRLTPDPDWRPDSIHELDRQLARVYRSSRRLYERTGRVPLVLFRKVGRPTRNQAHGGRMCGAGSGRALTVDVDGQVTGCVLFAGSYLSTSWTRLQPGLPALQIGHLGDPEFAARLAAYPERARESGLLVRPPAACSSYGRCSECRHRPRCHVCPASIGSGDGDANRVPDLFCAYTRVALKYRDRFPRQPADADLRLLRARLPKLSGDTLAHDRF